MTTAPDAPPARDDGAEVEHAAQGTQRLSPVVESQFDAIRLALANRRRSLGLSMSELARQVGVSPSMISQIERGLTLPSVATLFALAAALGATVDAFFAEAAGGDRSPAGRDGGASGDDARRGERATVRQSTQPPRSARSPREALYVVRASGRAGIAIRGGVRWERLTPVSLEEIEFLELIYEPHAESDAELYRHPGVEMVVVLEGRFDIHIGFERYELGVGDSMLFPSSLPHRYVNPTNERSRAVTLILRDSVGLPEGQAFEDLCADVDSTASFHPIRRSR